MNKPRHYYRNLGMAIACLVAMAVSFAVMGFEFHRHDGDAAVLFLGLGALSYAFLVFWGDKWFALSDKYHKALKAAGLPSNNRKSRPKERKVRIVTLNIKPPRRVRYLGMRSRKAGFWTAFACALLALGPLGYGMFTGNGWIGTPPILVVIVCAVAMDFLEPKKQPPARRPAQQAPTQRGIAHADILSSAADRAKAVARIGYALEIGAIQFEEWNIRDSVAWMDRVTVGQLADVTRDLPRVPRNTGALPALIWGALFVPSVFLAVCALVTAWALGFHALCVGLLSASVFMDLVSLGAFIRTRKRVS